MTAQIARRLTGLPQRSHTPVSPPSALWGLQRTKCPSSLQELVCAWALHFKHHYLDVGVALLACGSVLGFRYLEKNTSTRGAMVRAISTAVVVAVLAHGVRFPTYFLRREWPSCALMGLHVDPRVSRVQGKLRLVNQSPLSGSKVA